MKKILAILAAIILTASVFAQAPQKMSYQAIIRNSSGKLVTSVAVGMQISIFKSSATGTAVYVETQTPTTNANGLVAIEIGGGTIVSGKFDTINWAAGPYFIKTETDPTGGTSYTITGTSQLLSVPYALYAKTAESVTNTTTNTISIPAFALSIPPNSTIITQDNDGLHWQQNYKYGASFVLKKPSNYSGSDVVFSILFMTTTSTSGVVDFFIRPQSFNSGEGGFDIADISSTGVNVSGQLGFGTLYEQNFIIPANRFTKNWWQVVIQNQGASSTYPDNVVVKSVSLTY
jgi:hypothetical protein